MSLEMRRISEFRLKTDYLKPVTYYLFREPSSAYYLFNVQTRRFRAWRVINGELSRSHESTLNNEKSRQVAAALRLLAICLVFSHLVKALYRSIPSPSMGP